MKIRIKDLADDRPCYDKVRELRRSKGVNVRIEAFMKNAPRDKAIKNKRKKHTSTPNPAILIDSSAIMSYIWWPVRRTFKVRRTS